MKIVEWWAAKLYVGDGRREFDLHEQFTSKAAATKWVKETLRDGYDFVVVKVTYDSGNVRSR